MLVRVRGGRRRCRRLAPDDRAAVSGPRDGLRPAPPEDAGQGPRRRRGGRGGRRRASARTASRSATRSTATARAPSRSSSAPGPIGSRRSPPSLSFEQAAALPISAGTALQAVRDSGAVKAGQSVLVIGAAGGVGAFAVQIAKELGARVTGVTQHRQARARALARRRRRHRLHARVDSPPASASST